MARPFVDPNDRYSYEDWMNDMATKDDDPTPTDAVRAEVERVIRELRAYNPAADEYKGEHIHKVWARELESALASQPRVDAGAVLLQRRARVIGNEEWGRWSDCDPAAADRIRQNPRIGKFEFEVRSLYTTPPIPGVCTGAVACHRVYKTTPGDLLTVWMDGDVSKDDAPKLDSAGYRVQRAYTTPSGNAALVADLERIAKFAEIQLPIIAHSRGYEPEERLDVPMAIRKAIHALTQGAAPSANGNAALVTLIAEIRDEANALAIDEGRGPLPTDYYIRRYAALTQGASDEPR